MSRLLWGSCVEVGAQAFIPGGFHFPNLHVGGPPALKRGNGPTRSLARVACQH